MAYGVRSLIILIGPLAAALWIVPVAGLLVHAGHGETPVNRTLPHTKPSDLKHSVPTTPAKQTLTPEARKSAKQRPVTGKIVKSAKSLAVAKQESPEAAGEAGTLPGGEPYRYTLHEPASGKPKRSLILLGPWNGSTGFFDSWLLEDFKKLEPETMDNYRILDCVARKVPSNPYAYNAWYEYEDWHSETPVAHDVDLAVAYVHSLIEQEAEIVGYYEYVVVAGFSQGANVALEAALRFHSPLGLVFSQRGILLEARKQDTTAVATTPYLLTAGADDDTYAVEMVKENCRWLESMSAPAYMKTMSGLDHYRRSKEECELALKIICSDGF